MNKEEALKKFEEVYKYQISPKISVLEKERNNIALICFIPELLAGLTLLSFIPVTILFIISNIYEIESWRFIAENFHFYFIFFIFVILTAVFFYKIKKNFQKKCKRELLQPILSIFNLKLKSNKNFKIDDILKIGIYQNANRIYEDDSIIGCHPHSSIIISDLELAHKTIKQTPYTLYRGLIIKFQSKFQFDGILIKQNLMQENILSSINNINKNFINPDSIHYKQSNFKEFIFDDNNKTIKFHTNNIKQAEKFIKTPLFKKLQNLNKILTTEITNFAIYKNQIYLFVFSNETSTDIDYKYSSDFFEINEFSFESNIKNEQTYKNLFSQIYKISTAIDYLISENIN